MDKTVEKDMANSSLDKKYFDDKGRF